MSDFDEEYAGCAIDPNDAIELIKTKWPERLETKESYNGKIVLTTPVMLVLYVSR